MKNNNLYKSSSEDNKKLMESLKKEFNKKGKDKDKINVTKELVEIGYSIEEIASILDISCTLLGS